MSFKYIQMFWVILLLRIVRELTASCSIISHVFERGEQFRGEPLRREWKTSQIRFECGNIKSWKSAQKDDEL